MRKMAFDCCLKDNKECIHKGDFKHIHDKENKISKSIKFKSAQKNELFTLIGIWYVI